MFGTFALSVGAAVSSNFPFFFFDNVPIFLSKMLNVTGNLLTKNNGKVLAN